MVIFDAREKRRTVAREASILLFRVDLRGIPLLKATMIHTAYYLQKNRSRTLKLIYYLSFLLEMTTAGFCAIGIGNLLLVGKQTLFDTPRIPFIAQ
jgi:hypothetical protein